MTFQKRKDLPEKKEDKKHSKYLKSVKDRNGTVIGYEFNPSSQMRIWLNLRSDKRNAGKPDHEILKEVGWKQDLVNEWLDKFGEEFVEWYQDALHIASKPIKDLLTQVGNEKAMSDFQYWKELARTHGVISAEKTETELSVGALTRNLDKLSQEELNARANAMLSQARTLEHTPDVDMAGTPNDEGSRSGSNGASPSEERSMAVPDASRSN